MKYFKLLVLGFIAAAGLLLYACAGQRTPHYSFPVRQMSLPPGGLSPEQAPLFVSFGSDDNPYSGLQASGGGGGVHYLTELFAARTNPAGSGNPRTFDRAPVHYSFYVNTKYITPDGDEDPALVMQSWKEAIDHGHEIAVHTHSHPHGKGFTVKQWEDEINLCLRHLTNPEGMNVPRSRIIGFRTPFLEYADPVFSAMERAGGFVYDCSIDEGFQQDADGRNFIWPYKLDHGSPGNSATYDQFELPLVREHRGLWELPVYAFIVPPDDLCVRYGVPPGLRTRLKERNDYFDAEQGKITGMDWNLWYEFGMDKAEFLATLKYSFDLRLEGNRCPFLFGMHSGIYADRSPESPPAATLEERKEALREFLDYVLSKPETRVVSAKELLEWLQSPSPLFRGSASSNSKTQLLAQAPVKAAQTAVTDATAVSGTTASLPIKIGAGFRYSVFNPKVDPDPAYWARVGREMAAKFQGAVPEGIWIVSRVKEKGSQLSFPVDDPGDPLISGSDGEDRNEAALKLFDKLGYRVWLQLEPGFAPVDKLIHHVLKRYAAKHSCIVGVGVDVEWYRSTNPDAGDPVTDDLARAWLAAARQYNPKYRLFLKHWLVDRMPPTVRDGILFVDDSQVFTAMEPMVDEFAQWGKTFAPHPVAFQIGYPSDRPWWSKLNDPPREIGGRILQLVPNTEAILWVDFSILEVFPKTK